MKCYRQANVKTKIVSRRTCTDGQQPKFPDPPGFSLNLLEISHKE